MSHITTIELDIKDLDALKVAAEKLGLEFRRGQSTYRWYGRKIGSDPLPVGFKESDLGKCEHALSVKGNPGAYEIGIVKRRDGRPGYSLLVDWWDGAKGLTAKVGDNANMLRQGYATEITKRYWRKKGYAVTETRREDGTVILNAVK